MGESDRPPVVLEVVVTCGPARRSFVLSQTTTEAESLVDALHAGADGTLPAQAGLLRELANALVDEMNALSGQREG